MSHHLKTFADTHHKICENCSKKYKYVSTALQITDIPTFVGQTHSNYAVQSYIYAYVGMLH